VPDRSAYKLGKLAPRIDDKRLMLRNYLTPDLPPPPASVDWTKGVTSFGFMLNNTLGDCVIASLGHSIQIWSLNAGTEVTVPDSVIEDYYEWWAGYVPGDPSTDNGYVLVDALNNWRAKGFDYHKLLGYADPDLNNVTHLQQSVALFGGLHIGLQMPITAQSQDVWSVVPGGGPNSQPGSWGGHAVYVCGYNATGPVCVSWGEVIQMTWEFWNAYVDEAHTSFGMMWIENGGASPSGFRMEQLLSDLSAFGTAA
jgi:hypothetical protein